MPAYFDASVLLSLVIGDAHAEQARALWHNELERVSSILVDVECRTALRRVPQASWIEAQRTDALQRLELALDEITIKPLDEDVAALVRSTPDLSGCRTLDAVHVATALFFRAADAELRLCTFDQRMAVVAARLGFVVCGCG